MGNSTISMAIFNSYVGHNQRVTPFSNHQPGPPRAPDTAKHELRLQRFHGQDTHGWSLGLLVMLLKMWDWMVIYQGFNGGFHGIYWDLMVIEWDLLGFWLVIEWEWD